MPPIKVHIDDPITPKKGQDTGTSDIQSSSYHAAQPGAAAVPAATPQAQTQPTRTTATNDYGPPPPQPGAVPVPPSQPALMTASNQLPPPPKAGEAARRQPAVTTMPPQLGIPPPQQNSAPTRGTMYSPPETSGSAPTTMNFGAVPAPTATQVGSHPPGYQQDLNAQEMSSAQRASLDASERREGLGQGLGMGKGDASNDTVASAWNAVKGWATAAGNTLAETEKEVWKRINKE